MCAHSDSSFRSTSDWTSLLYIVLARFPEDENEAEDAGDRVEEIDAEEFTKQASPEAEAEAKRVAEESRKGRSSGGSSCTIA